MRCKLSNCYVSKGRRKYVDWYSHSYDILGVVARARNMSQLARDTGLPREGLYKALSPEGNPTFSTVAKVAKALGFKLTVQRAV